MKYNKRTLAFKVSAIYLAEQRRCSLLETARELGVSKSVLGYWLKTKDRILSAYYPSTEDSDEGREPEGAVSSLSGEESMGKGVSDNDLRKQNKGKRQIRRSFAVNS